MDAIDVFKLKALDSMKTTVTALSNEVEKSKGYIARAEGAAQNAVSGPGRRQLQAGGAVSDDAQRRADRAGRGNSSIAHASAIPR